MTEPSPRDLRLFGVLLPAFFLVVGLVAGHRLHSSAATRALWLAGAALTAVYALVPAARRPIFLGWIRAARPIGVVVSHVLLTLVFVLLVTPIALLLRLLGQDPLSRRADPSAPTYWQARTGSSDPRRYLQQF